jgi:hypothetical protein
VPHEEQRRPQRSPTRRTVGDKDRRGNRHISATPDIPQTPYIRRLSAKAASRRRRCRGVDLLLQAGVEVTGAGRLRSPRPFFCACPLRSSRAREGARHRHHSGQPVTLLGTQGGSQPIRRMSTIRFRIAPSRASGLIPWRSRQAGRHGVSLTVLVGCSWCGSPRLARRYWGGDVCGGMALRSSPTSSRAPVSQAEPKRIGPTELMGMALACVRRDRGAPLLRCWLSPF